MKKIITLLTFVFIAGTMALNAQQTDKTSLVYSEDDEALVYKSEPGTTNEIMIESLPGYGEESVPIDVYQNEKGMYTFTKHPALVLPEYYNVVILDSVTGSEFDLRASDSYTFEVKKNVPERFVLIMSKAKTEFTAMR
jgi:hypothetical protein